jgi:hypothetical protein
VFGWAGKYDGKLDSLKAQVANMSEDVGALNRAMLETDPVQEAYSLDQFQKEYSVHMDEAGDVRTSDWQAHVGSDFKSKQPDIWDPKTHMDDTMPEMLSKWKSPEGQFFFLWKKPNNTFAVVDGKGTPFKLAKTSSDLNGLEQILSNGYGWTKQNQDELQLAGEDLGDEMSDDLVEYAEPGDEYPIPSTLSDEELAQQIDWAKTMMSSRGGVGVEPNIALNTYYDELQAEMSTR